MNSLREIRKRIKSINNTAKITHAMELVAAAKMKKIQDLTITSRPYTKTINKLVQLIAKQVRKGHHPLLAEKEAGKTLVIFFSTERGLTGSLNTNLNKVVAQFVNNKGIKNLSFITIGKKARNFIVKIGGEIIADFPNKEVVELNFASALAKLAIDNFINSDVSSVTVIYPEFISTLRQEVRLKQILPITYQESIQTQQDYENHYPLDILLFEPNLDVILETILPQYILVELYQIWLENKASEHSARMIAMKNATENALELVDDLTLTYNTFRQEAITNEILDIARSW